ncbi:MAG: CRISPR-associated helicase Cas3' [Pseudomonadota bacterium]
MKTQSIPLHVAHHRAADGEWQTLAEHLTGVAAWAKLFASKLGLGKLGELLGLLHDLGKYSQAFQTYLKSATGHLNPDEDEEWVDAGKLKGKVDHSSAGAQFAWQTLSQRNSPAARMVGQLVALCVASHHSGLIDCISPDGEDNFTRRMSKGDEKTHLAEALQVADAEIMSRCSQLLEDPELLIEVDLVLKRIEQHHQPRGEVLPGLQQFGLFVRFVFSCLIAGDRIDTALFENPQEARLRPLGTYARWSILIERLESHLAAFPTRHPIDALRRDISQYCLHAALRAKGIYTLTVPTGGGKTLASLRFALHHAQERKLDRIIYVIPFTSIIDQNAKVVRSILEPASEPEETGRIVLEHHSNLTPEFQTWREKMLCEDWDAPVIYTTMVQFLETLFGAGTRGARRMHQLANTVLVFDEVQTLPIRCVHLFNNAVNFLTEQCNSTVVLCTATQPLLHQVDPKKGAIRLAADHELMPNVGELFEQLKRVDVRDMRKATGWTDAEVAELALDSLRRKGSCLVIVNTKAAAKNIFALVNTDLGEEVAYHLSTDMCPAHRKKVLSKVCARLQTQKPTLCISTQLIEAGVDVDFQTVIRFLAGMDSIAQAAGRCNRNGRPDPGAVYIVNPKEENLTMLPDIASGRGVTQRVLDDYGQVPDRYLHNLVGPELLKDYYRYYFFQRQQEMSYAISSKDLGFSGSLLELLSSNAQSVNAHKHRYNRSPDYLFRQPFMMASRIFKAIDSPTEGVVVPYGKEGKELINSFFSAGNGGPNLSLLRKAQQYTVNVFPHVLKRLIEAGALTPVGSELRVYCLDPRHYSNHFGLTAEAVNPMEALIWN